MRSKRKTGGTIKRLVQEYLSNASHKNIINLTSKTLPRKGIRPIQDMKNMKGGGGNHNRKEIKLNK